MNRNDLSLSSSVVVVRRSSRGVGPRNEVREEAASPARHGKALAAQQSSALSRRLRRLGQGHAEHRGEEEEEDCRESHRGRCQSRRRRPSSRGA